MKGKRTSPTKKEIFWFDCGRAFQVGLMSSLSKCNRMSFVEYFALCQSVLEPISSGDQIPELYRAYVEGYDRATEAKAIEALSIKPSREMM